MKTFAEIIQDIMRDGASLSDVADGLGVSKSSALRLSRGTILIPQNADKAMAYLKMTRNEYAATIAYTQRKEGRTGNVPKGFQRDVDEERKRIEAREILGGEFRASELPAPHTYTPSMYEASSPVYGSVQGGDEGVFLFNGVEIDTVYCPPHLVGVPGVYALEVEGVSMISKYNPGDMIWAVPPKRYQAGDGVVVQLQPHNEGDSPLGFIKEYVRTTPTKLVVKQLNPEMEIEYDLKDVLTVHAVGNVKPR